MSLYYATEAAYKNGYIAGRKDALSISKEPTEKKQYLIDEDTLKSLLFASHKLEILERGSADNWEWCMEGRTGYLAECAAMLPWNEGRGVQDLMAQIEEEEYCLDNLVDDQIDAFWEEYRE